MRANEFRKDAEMFKINFSFNHRRHEDLEQLIAMLATTKL